MELPDGVGEPVPVVVRESPRPQLVLIQPPDRSQHSHRELAPRHFHAEHRDGKLVLHRDVLGHVERKRGLSHRGASGDDDQVPRLQSRGLAIEVAVARRNAGDVRRVVLVVQEVDAFHDLREQGLDLHESLARPRPGLGDLEDLGLGLVEQLPDVLAHAVQGAVGDLGRHLDQFPQDRALAHDLGVAPHVVCRRRIAGKSREVGNAAGLVLVLAYLDRLVHRDHVGGPAALDQPGDVAEDAAVVVPVEIAVGDDVADLVEGAVVDQESPEHGLLRVDRMRRNL